MPKQQGTEFFYLDEHGNKQDADLHNPILRAAEFRVDEKIMAPIRERHRRKYLAEFGSIGLMAVDSWSGEFVAHDSSARLWA
jgi:hypothetical protein